MIGWLNDINRLVSKDKREHHESSQQKTSRGRQQHPPAPPARGPAPPALLPRDAAAPRHLTDTAPDGRGTQASRGTGLGGGLILQHGGQIFPHQQDAGEHPRGHGLALERVILTCFLWSFAYTYSENGWWA